MSGRRARGLAAEQDARHYLEAQGLRLREANWYCKLGEIDLIMTSGDTLVFVEVRYRTPRGFGDGLDSISDRKRRRIVRAATRYLQQYRLLESPARFDVVSIDPDRGINWIPGAFTADGDR